MTVKLLKFWCGEDCVEFFLRLFAFVLVLGLVWLRWLRRIEMINS